MRYKGFFRPRKISKYKGDHREIVYRSKLELTFMKYCDDNDAILEWSSEEIIIPYRSPVDGKLHRYFPDFWVRTPNGQTLIEIKPSTQTKPPNPKRRRTKTGRKSKRYLREVNTYIINEAKWKSANEFCMDNGMEFKILTEDHLNPKYK